MAFDPEETLAAFVIRRPLAGRALARHGIDYAVRGERSLRVACTEASLEAGGLLAEIEALEHGAPAPVRWEERPLEEILERLIQEHVDLRRDLEDATRLAAELAASDAGLLPIAGSIAALGEDMPAHMLKEERVLFPWIRSGLGATAAGPIRVMYAEHEDAMTRAEEVRALARDHAPRTAAQVALGRLLERLDHALLWHIHLENHVLFPRTLAL